MSKNKEAGMVRSAINWLAGFIPWIEENLKDKKVRKAILLDLGLDPSKDKELQLPKENVNSIDRYRQSINPDEQATQKTLDDIEAVYDALKKYIKSFSDGVEGSFSELLHQFLQLLATNYIRQRSPQVYYISQLLGFIKELPIKEDHITPVIKVPFLAIKEVFLFLIHPIYYISQIPEKLIVAKNSKEAEQKSNFFLVLASMLGYLENEGFSSIRYLYGWDPNPDEEPSWEDSISNRTFSFDYRAFNQDEKNNKKVVFLGGSFIIISAEELNDNPGLLITLTVDKSIKIALNENWEFSLGFSSAGILDLYLAAKDSTFNGPSDLKIRLAIQRKTDPKTGKSYSWPNAEGSRLDIGKIAFSSELSTKDIGIAFEVKDNAVVLSTEDLDGFMKEIIPKKDLAIKFSLALGYGKKRGFFFEPAFEWPDNLSSLASRSALSPRNTQSTAEEGKRKEKVDDLETVLVLHQNEGLLNIETLAFSHKMINKGGRTGVGLDLTVSLSSKLGPLFVRVDDIGIQGSLLEPGENANLLLTHLDYAFRPPSRVGILLDSEVIYGGGYLEFDQENYRYAGILSLNFLDIELSAIGLINTRLPNNQKGFSMLLSISVLFNPSIQLAYGFTLNGVGGLIGIHRTMKVEALRTRIRNGSIESIMFPKNVIENAPKIISDLRAVFPPQKKHYVLAPFLRIGWGTPTIVEIDLGILAELPFKGRLILLGSVGIYLPNKDIEKRLVELHIDVFGDFNFAASYVLIEGRLRDSQVVGITLTGGFAFMLDWGPNPQFLFSVGGYHPRYKKPARFPAIPRLTALVKKGDSIRLTCEYYQAITSNSFQIGFRADLVIQKGRARAWGFLGFNTLIQFDPFQFEADIRISIGVSYRGRTFAGVDLYFLLTGPKPWRAKGYAKIKIWFFSLKIRFNYAWGGTQKSQASEVQASELLDKLIKQLNEASNWAGKLPDKFSAAESLSTLDETEKGDRIFVHPSGYLELRQTLIPLNRTIEKLGNSYVKNRFIFNIESYKLGEKENTVNQKTIREYFSRGQFEDLPDNEKIASVDFELMQAGIHLAPNDAFQFSPEMKSTDNDFEDIILGKEEDIILGKSKNNWQNNRILNLSSNQRAAREADLEVRYGVVEDFPIYGEKAYEVVTKIDLSRPESIEDNYFMTYGEAKEYFRTISQEKKERWQIREVE